MMEGFIVADVKYKRIVFKLSGESLAGEQRYGINPEVVESIAKQIKKVREFGIEVAIDSTTSGLKLWNLLLNR